MSRRVLLIDSDTDFRDTLAEQLGRYRIAVITETDPDAAIGEAGGEIPDLMIIAVDEPDKTGFRTFQKARKLLPARLPIMLVTSTMPEDSFEKHRNLRVHADDYIDKRGLNVDVLIGKLDNMIGLGDPGDDLPLDDDIPMELADGDVVLDEHVEEDAAGDGSGKVDQMVAAETDAAFDALMGPMTGSIPKLDAEDVGVRDDVEPPQSEPAAEASAVPEPVPHKISDGISDAGNAVPQSAGADVDSIPKPIDDVQPPVDSELRSDEPVHVEPVPVPIEPIVEEASLVPSDSFSSIPIADADLLSLDDDVEDVEQSDAAVPTAIEAGHVEREPATPTAEASGVDEAITPHREPSGAIPRIIGREPSAPGDTTAPREPIIPDAARPEAAQRPRSSSVDLGLDKLAQDAESEQSGVYDRKSLRKIGELERQIAQLKIELERARAAAESADKGGNRESQFLKLREGTLAKETELKQVKTKLEQQSKELAEAQEKLRQTLESNASLEANTTELEERLSDIIGKNKELAQSLKAATSQAAELEQEVEAKTKAAAAAESQAAQAEKDLANERANRAASASDAERNLRRDRDQLLARHKGEMAALRAETEATAELAVARIREEMDGERVNAVRDAIAETERKAAQAQAVAIAKVQEKHNGELVEIKRQHAGELSALRNELGEQMEQLRAHLDGVKAEHGSELDAMRSTHEVKIVELAAVHEQEKTTLQNAHRHELADLRNRNDQEVSQLADAAKRQIETHQAEVADEKAKAAALLAATQETSDRALAEVRSELAAVERRLEEATARHAAEREQLEQTHAAGLGELQAKLDAEHKRAIASLKAEADRMLRQLEEERDRHIQELKSERDELEKGLSGARDSLQKSQNELATAVSTIADRTAEVRAHVQAIAERDQRIAELRKEIESLEQENANYQEQVLRAYQKIKADEAMVARARKAMAIALTVLDDEGNSTERS